MTIAINELNLSYGTKCLLQDILNFSNTKDGCYAQNRYFATKYGITISGISKAIARLVKSGLVKLDNSKTKWNVGRIIKPTRKLINLVQEAKIRATKTVKRGIDIRQDNTIKLKKKIISNQSRDDFDTILTPKDRAISFYKSLGIEFSKLVIYFSKKRHIKNPHGLLIAIANDNNLYKSNKKSIDAYIKKENEPNVNVDVNIFDSYEDKTKEQERGLVESVTIFDIYEAKSKEQERGL